MPYTILLIKMVGQLEATNYLDSIDFVSSRSNHKSHEHQGSYVLLLRSKTVLIPETMDPRILVCLSFFKTK